MAHTTLVLLVGSRTLKDPAFAALAGDRSPLWEIGPGFGLHSPDSLQLLVFWCVFFGLALLPLAALIHHVERQGQEVPRFVAVQLAALGIAGGILLPVSGFWLTLVPAWEIWKRTRRLRLQGS